MTPLDRDTCPECGKPVERREFPLEGYYDFKCWSCGWVSANPPPDPGEKPAVPVPDRDTEEGREAVDHGAGVADPDSQSANTDPGAGTAGAPGGFHPAPAGNPETQGETVSDGEFGYLQGFEAGVKAEQDRAAAVSPVSGGDGRHSVQRDVEDFHRALDIPVHSSPAIRRPELRAELIREEATETIEAIERGDLVEAIDGFCDLLCVVYGAAAEFGVDLAPFWDEVHRTNMAKRGGPVREDGKRLKPEGWEPPDIAGLLAPLLSPVVDEQEEQG